MENIDPDELRVLYLIPIAGWWLIVSFLISSRSNEIWWKHFLGLKKSFLLMKGGEIIATIILVIGTLFAFYTTVDTQKMLEDAQKINYESSAPKK